MLVGQEPTHVGMRTSVSVSTTVHIRVGGSHLTCIKYRSNGPRQDERDQSLWSDGETEVRGPAQVVGILRRSLEK